MARAIALQRSGVAYMVALIEKYSQRETKFARTTKAHNRAFKKVRSGFPFVMLRSVLKSRGTMIRKLINGYAVDLDSADDIVFGSVAGILPDCRWLRCASSMGGVADSRNLGGLGKNG